jgi:hypothetical protein
VSTSPQRMHEIMGQAETDTRELVIGWPPTA